MNRTVDHLKSLRHEMESGVVACNCFLKDHTDNMDEIVLLRNMHPLSRPGFAKTLYERNILTKSEVVEFLSFD